MIILEKTEKLWQKGEIEIKNKSYTVHRDGKNISMKVEILTVIFTTCRQRTFLNYDWYL